MGEGVGEKGGEGDGVGAGGLILCRFVMDRQVNRGLFLFSFLLCALGFLPGSFLSPIFSSFLQSLYLSFLSLFLISTLHFPDGVWRRQFALDVR